MRGAIYARVSSEDQARSGYGIPAQMELCRNKANEIGLSDVAEFVDEGISGSVLTRPGLTALRESVKSGLFDVVIALDPDRLSRNLSHQLLLTEEIEKHGVRIEFVDFEWKSTPEGQLFYALKGAIAQYEREKIKERTIRGRLQKAKSGKLPSAYEPYGYVYDSRRNTLSIHPFEAEVVKWIFDWLVVEGLGPGDIARRLNELGVPTKRGAPEWHRTVVNQIMRNPVYTGVFYANRYCCTELALNRYKPPEERARMRLRPRKEWIPIEVPAIVEKGRWEEAQERMGNARRLWAGRRVHSYLLSGLISCGDCGGKMNGSVLVQWGKRERFYVCAKRKRGEIKCRLKVKADLAEERVWRLICELLGDPFSEAWDQCERSMNESAEDESKRLASEMVRLRRTRMRLISAMEVRLSDLADITTEYLKRTESELKCLEARKAELEELRRLRGGECGPGIAGKRDFGNTGLKARSLAKTWLERPDAMPIARRREIVRQIVESVLVSAGEIEIRVRVSASDWKEGLEGNLTLGTRS